LPGTILPGPRCFQRLEALPENIIFIGQVSEFLLKEDLVDDPSHEPAKDQAHKENA
jgi:hypothetical protein